MATADQTVSAVLEATSKRYVVETGSSEDGNSHFTLYSDGWLEQSGIILSGFSGLITVRLLKAFKDKKYTVLVNREEKTVDTDGLMQGFGTNYGDKTESSFSISAYAPDKTGAWSWSAQGYTI